MTLGAPSTLRKDCESGGAEPPQSSNAAYGTADSVPRQQAGDCTRIL